MSSLETRNVTEFRLDPTQTGSRCGEIKLNSDQMRQKDLTEESTWGEAGYRVEGEGPPELQTLRKYHNSIFN